MAQRMASDARVGAPAMAVRYAPAWRVSSGRGCHSFARNRTARPEMAVGCTRAPAWVTACLASGLAVASTAAEPLALPAPPVSPWRRDLCHSVPARGKLQPVPRGAEDVPKVWYAERDDDEDEDHDEDLSAQEQSRLPDNDLPVPLPGLL